MIDNLSFNVAQLLRDPVGSSRYADVVVDLQHLVPELVMAVGPEPSSGAILRGGVRLMHTNAGILAQGRLATEVYQVCARCLEPAPVSLAIELEEVYTPTIDIVTGKAVVPDEEDRALWIDEHHILDLSEVLRQDVLVNLPLHALCKEDCQGLCPTCGKNLNEGPCACQPEVDPRWGVLTDLLKKVNEKESSSATSSKA